MFAFKCGCELNEKTLHFAEGRLVCPEHGEDLAPFPRDEPPWRGVMHMSFDLEAPVRAVAERVVDGLIDYADTQQVVRNIVVTIEDSAGSIIGSVRSSA